MTPRGNKHRGKSVCEGTGSNDGNERESPGHTHCPRELRAVPSLGEKPSSLAVSMTENNFSQHRFRVGEERSSLQ